MVGINLAATKISIYHVNTLLSFYLSSILSSVVNYSCIVNFVSISIAMCLCVIVTIS